MWQMKGLKTHKEVMIVTSLRAVTIFTALEPLLIWFSCQPLQFPMDNYNPKIVNEKFHKHYLWVLALTHRI